MASDLESDSERRFRGDARFRPIAFVGSGGMGAVYRVLDCDLGSEVALKTIHARQAEQIYRLKHEFRSLAGIIHPNLIQLHDLVVRDDACFFTMEFVEGLDFVEHVRHGCQRGLDAQGLQRFGDAAAQLARGLSALHAAGRLHRDIKPPNVLVRPDGRVVILDFDLAAPLAEVGVQEGVSGEFAGTYAYMSPEQLWGMALTPAADWYAVGVVFHESLTGRHPFGDGAPPAPGTSVAGVELANWNPELPDSLHELIAAMLDPDPGRRPSGVEVLERLGAQSSPQAAARVTRGVDTRGHFVGRSSERTRLRRTFEAGGSPRAVGIRGVSGIGKSELVRQFLGELESAGAATVLVGRCHPQEAVPFKALDPIVDALTRHLLAQRPDTLVELIPEHAEAAARLFPVLSRVPQLAGDGADDSIDVVEARRRGVGSLRELLRRVAEATPLVVWVDDAQWSDADSAELLSDLLLPPSAPPLFLVLTYRSDVGEGIRLLDRLTELAREFSAFSFEELELGPLTPEEAMELARRTWPETTPVQELEELVGDAAGSPFLLGELMWHLETRPSPGSSRHRVDLRRVIAERLLELPAPERSVLELVSVCGRPTERGLLLDAAGLGPTGRPVLERLEGVGLVRTSPRGESREIEAYHDRIRETVSTQLSSEELSTRHRELATTFEASGRAEPDVLAHHFHGAGELPKAAGYAVDAADRAAEALAFVRAAELYGQARSWGDYDAERARALRVCEADSLGKGARLVDAGRLFLEAAEDAPEMEGLELRCRAVEAVVGADVDVGLGILGDLLRDLGMRYPRSSQRALLAAVARLVGIVFRGLEPRGVARELDAVEQIRIDLCYAVGVRLVSADSGRGIYFSMLALERALRAHDPERQARSLSAVGGSIAVVGGGPIGRIGQRMMVRAQQIGAAVDSPPLNGTIDVGLAQVLMLSGRCREALERGDRGVRILSEQCQGFAFECNFGRANALRALEELGQLGEMGARAQELRDAADADGNRYAEALACQYLAVSRIAAGDSAGARELARRGLELWTRRDFHMQHFYGRRILALCDLYEGQPELGWERLSEVDRDLKRSGLLRVPLIRADVNTLRGQLALASASRNAAKRAGWLGICRRSARQLASEGRSDGALHAALLEAGVAALEADRSTARARLEGAASIAEAAEFALRGACARLRLAELSDDTLAADRARQHMRACGVAEPSRWADVCAPGFG